MDKESLIGQQIMSDIWDCVFPPPDGQIVINRLGTVCMSYKTFQDLGYESKDEKVMEWLKEWEER